MIREATHADIPALVALAKRMHGASIHADLLWDEPKMRGLLPGLIDNPGCLALVAERAGEVIGGFLACEEEMFFSREKFSCDLAVFVAPEHRGGMAAARLINAYVAWGKSRDVRCINAGVASGINHDVSIALFHRLGFVTTGVTLEYKGKP
jgi:L-amino acid N-acyltransferase YncA